MQLHRILTLLGVATGLAAGALFMSSNRATAVQAADAPVLLPPTIDPANLALSVEGPLQAIEVGGRRWTSAGSVAIADATSRRLQVNGTWLSVPPGMLIDVNNDALGDIALERLVYSSGTTEQVRSPIGGTIIANATGSITGAGAATFTTDDIYFDFGEQVIVGPLISVAADNQSFQVAGHVVRMSADNRFLPKIMDLGGAPIGIAPMRGFEGTTVTCEGYTENGQYFGKTVETEVIQTVAPLDSVAVSRALYSAKDGSFTDIVGSIQYATNNNANKAVRLWFGLPAGTSLATLQGFLNDANPNNDGIAVTITAGVAANLGDFRFRSARGLFPTNPGNVVAAVVRTTTTTVNQGGQPVTVVALNATGHTQRTADLK